MTVLKDIPEKWFPVVLPIQKKKETGFGGKQSKKKRTGTRLTLRFLLLLLFCFFYNCHLIPHKKRSPVIF